jgi:hypothetical protein
MPAGLQVWDASGNLILDYTDRISRILGIVTISGNVAGSVTSSGFSGLDPFWHCVPLVSYPTYSPQFSFNAGTNTLSWTWPRSGPDHQLIYGAY